MNLLLTTLLTLLATAAAAALTGWVQTYVARYTNRIRQARAYGRIMAEPLYRPGAPIAAIYKDTNGGWERLGEAWVIDEISVGRVLLAGHAGEGFREGRVAALWPMTCREFEAMHIIIADEQANENEAET